MLEEMGTEEGEDGGTAKWSREQGAGCWHKGRSCCRGKFRGKKTGRTRRKALEEEQNAREFRRTG